MLKWLFTDYSGRTGRGMYCQPGAALAGLGLFENAVEFMGTDLPSVYRIVVFIIDANLFFNPNREVTFGLVTAEAMACGTPSIVYQDTAGEEIVSDPNFVISKLDEILPMIDRLKNLPSYPKDKLRYIMASKFDFNNTLKNYFELYNKLLQNTSK